jgi:hypothetical protein
MALHFVSLEQQIRPQNSSKLQTLTYISITQEVRIMTEDYSLQDLSRNKRTLVCLFLFVKQRQEGNG